VILMEFPRILVVDDDPSVRRVLTRSLRLEGFSPLEASDGEHAVTMALEHRPAAVLLDLMLPGLSGLNVLEQLRGAGFKAPVLILSGNDERHTREAIATSSADGYLVKPVALNVLFDELRARLQGCVDGRVDVSRA
jgi:DNA-binding response OmpR family regulator